MPPSGTFSEDATAPRACTKGTAQACPSFRVSPMGTASSAGVSNAALFHWNCTYPLRKTQFGSRCSRRRSVEIISLLCCSKPTSSLCHFLHLQTTGFAWRLTSGDAILVPVIKIHIFLHLGYRGRYAWTRKDGSTSVTYLLRD